MWGALARVLAMARLHAAKCPTCGAGIHVDPGAASAVCRYCQNVITIEKRAPPPTATPFGVPGGMPSTTLYIDPKAIGRATSKVVAIIALTTLIPVLIPLAIFVGGPLVRGVKGTVRPFPATCGLNETLTLSGSFDGPGPAITSVAHNCKITIKGSKIKAGALFDTSGSNVELTIVDSTIETTGAAVTAGVNTKIRVNGGSVKSGGAVVDAKHNLEVTLEGTTLESTAGATITAPGIDLRAKDSTVRGKTAALEIDNLAEVKAEATTFEAEGSTFVFQTNPKVNLTGGAVISRTDRAIDGALNMELTVSGTKIQGAAGAVAASKGNLKLKASGKASFVATDGDAVEVDTNGKLTFADATVEASRRAIKAGHNLELTLKPGAQLTGKKGGVLADGNFEIDANGAAIDGGTGAGLEARGAKVLMRGGSLKGDPALRFASRPATLELDGTQVVGAKITR